MKQFLKFDYYLQLIVLVGYIVYIITQLILGSDSSNTWFLFYFVVGGTQLISYLIRIFLGFWKDLFIKIYGFMIMPIWIFLGLMCLDLDIDLFFFILIIGLFTSPFLALAYVIYCKEKIANK